MKRVLQTIGITVFALALGIGIISRTAYAADSLNVAIPVSVELEGAFPTEKEDYVLHLKTGEEAFPMPEGTVDGIYSMSVNGGGEFVFPEITYNKVGIYTYQIWMSVGENAFAIYDETVYDITVYVTNAEDGSGLESTVIAYAKEDEAEKTPVLFHLFYKTPAEITVVKKWADDGKDRPGSVTVQLLCDGEVYETVQLDDTNAWQHSWKMLLPDYEWTVKETNVPAGYTESYSEKEQVITITNTKALLQTGQMNWPIPLLIGAGLICIGVGCCLSICKKENETA